MNLKDFEKLNLKGLKVSLAELNPEKTYLVMVNVTSFRYTESFLNQLKDISDAFKNAGIKSIVLVNPMQDGVSQFEIGVDKELKSEKI